MGAGSRGPDIRAGGRITQTPSIRQIYHNTPENFDIIIKSSYTIPNIKVSLSLSLAIY